MPEITGILNHRNSYLDILLPKESVLAIDLKYQGKINNLMSSKDLRKVFEMFEGDTLNMRFLLFKYRGLVFVTKCYDSTI